MATVIGASSERALQVRAAAPNQIPEAQFQAFLEHLAATCNVVASARAAGIGTAAAYRRRRVDEAFAAAWREAMQLGYERLEEALLARALSRLEPMGFEPDAVAIELIDPAGGSDDADRPDGTGRSGGTVSASGVDRRVALVDVQMAVAVLNRQRAKERDGPRRRGRPRASVEEIERVLGEKLDGLARRLNEQMR